MDDFRGRAQVRVETVTIPTYGVGEPDKNPMFFDNRTYQGSSGKVYPLPIIEKYVDEIVVVSEEAIAEAVRQIGMRAHLTAEPTSSVTIAALLEKKISLQPGEKVAALLTSGNYDIDLLGRFFKGEEVEPTLE